jgi:hypothetical protein
MAKLEYSAECLCGGTLATVFKKPTRMQPSVARAQCKGCKSEFMFTFSVEYSDGHRAYVPGHELIHMTEKLKEVLRAKKEQMQKQEVGT